MLKAVVVSLGIAQKEVSMTTSLDQSRPDLECAPRLAVNLRLPGMPARTRTPLSLDEQLLLDAYRQLSSVPHLAVRRYVLWRDIRLARAVYYRIFLHISLGQLRDQALNEVGQLPAPVEQYELPFIVT